MYVLMTPFGVSGSSFPVDFCDFDNVIHCQYKYLGLLESFTINLSGHRLLFVSEGQWEAVKCVAHIRLRLESICPRPLFSPFQTVFFDHPRATGSLAS
jgi:hypothetical protein